MSEQEHESPEEEASTAGGGSRRQNNLLVLFLIAMLLIGLVVSLAHFGSGGSSPYSPQSQAYVLAQQVQTQRQQTPTAKNYCEAQLYYHTTSGVSTGPSQIKDGFGSYPTHCEQVLLQRVSQTTLPSLTTQDYAQTSTIDVVVFSQVRVCVDCKPTFPTWENTLRQQVIHARGSAKTTLNLYVFDIRPGSLSGFAPGTFRAGPFSPPSQGTQPPVPVRSLDIRQVYPVKS